MAKDARLKAKAAKKRKSREAKVKAQKARKNQPRNPSDSGEALKPGDLPIKECVISKGWRERGLAHILLARELPGGKLYAGGWYVDTFCLGLKDTALLPGLDPEEYEEQIKPNIFNDEVEFEDCEPGLAKGIVEGAIEFAEQYTFKPSKRWKESRLAFSGIERAGDPEFGKDGKPCFINRGETNANAIINKLSRAAGEGSFTVEEGLED